MYGMGLRCKCAACARGPCLFALCASPYDAVYHALEFGGVKAMQTGRKGDGTEKY